MKILLVGNDYYINCYYNHRHMLNSDIQIYVLSTGKKVETVAEDCNIVTEKDLSAIIKKIDRVYFLNKDTIPLRLRQKIEVNLNKKAIIKYICLTENENLKNSDMKFDKKPCVLIIHDGHYNSGASLELQLIDSFYNKNIFLSCSLSDELSNAYIAFEDVIDSKYCDYINAQNSDLIIVSIDYKYLIDNQGFDSFEFIYNIAPDFVIFCAENNNIDKEEKINILRHRYGLPIDIYIYSEYMTYINEYGSMLYCNQAKKDSKDRNDSISYQMQSDIGEITATKIINKLYMPKEIRRIVK